MKLYDLYRLWRERKRHSVIKMKRVHPLGGRNASSRFKCNLPVRLETMKRHDANKILLLQFVFWKSWISATNLTISCPDITVFKLFHYLFLLLFLHCIYSVSCSAVFSVHCVSQHEAVNVVSILPGIKFSLQSNESLFINFMAQNKSNMNILKLKKFCNQPIKYPPSVCFCIVECKQC